MTAAAHTRSLKLAMEARKEGLEDELFASQAWLNRISSKLELGLWKKSQSSSSAWLNLIRIRIIPWHARIDASSE